MTRPLCGGSGGGGGVDVVGGEFGLGGKLTFSSIPPRAYHVFRAE